jgi:orotate phosphoribosyltransferase
LNVGCAFTQQPCASSSYKQVKEKDTLTENYSNLPVSKPGSSDIFAAAPDARAGLLALLARISFKLGTFTLSSGRTSDYYIDCRTTTLHAEGGRLAGLALLDLFIQHQLSPAAVGGLTMGADPLVSAIAIASAQRAVDATRRNSQDIPPLVHGFLVRKSEKAHGMGRRIEGFTENGAAVVIVDDVCTTGGSTIDAIAAARAGGFHVLGAACLVERTEAKGREAVESALREGVVQGQNDARIAPFLSLFTADDVRQAHITQLPR